MAPKKRHKRPRTRRLLRHEYEAARHRLKYLCELLFGGDRVEMAAKLGVCARDIFRILSGDVRVTLRLLAHVADKLDVRPEWLVCGTGAIRRTAYDADGLQFPAELHSSFPVFNTIEAGVHVLPPCWLKQPPKAKPPKDLQPYLQAGRAVYQALGGNKLVSFFLGSTAFTSFAADEVVPFYLAGFAGSLVVTLQAAYLDLSRSCLPTLVDINSLAKFAANRGIGYGEAIGMAAFDPQADRAKSVLASVFDAGLPVAVVAEVGELSVHTSPGLHGAETGAAIGAAAYVDLLILAEQLKSFFGSPGGVFVFAGEHVRGIRLVLQQIESLRASVPEPAGFTFVVFAPHDIELEHTIQHHGGSVIFLDHPTTAAMTQLFQTCHDAYAGKI